LTRNSVYPFIPNDSDASLEGLRQLHLAQEADVAPLGISGDDIILAWAAQTQAITPVLKNLRSIAKPAPTTIVQTPYNTLATGGLGAADIYIGVITLPYYLGVPSAEDPTAPLTDFWTAAPGAYVSPADTLGLDPTSTHVTVINPFPVVTSMQTVPVLMTVPNANSGKTKPAAGWPVVIFGHGFGGNRAYLLAAADTAAAAGYAVIAIDAPLHGISADDPTFGLFHISNTPFAGVANERTFDVDYNQDGTADPSGSYLLNFTSMLTFRDNLRQDIADLSVLAVTIPTIDMDGDTLPDLDGSTIHYAAHSAGAMAGPAFVAIEPMVKNAFLSAPMGGVARGLEASSYFGPPIRAALALLGVLPGTADYESFFLALQTVIDSADPINWGAEAARYNNIVLHEVREDFLVPNAVPTAPLSGTEPLIRAMGLTAYSSTQQDANGLDLAGRFVPPAHHGSFLSPVNTLTGENAFEAFVEMQKQFASFIASKGTAVVVTDAATMVPEAQVEKQSASNLTEGSNSKKAKGKQPAPPSNLMEAVRGLGTMASPLKRTGSDSGARSGPGKIVDQLQKPSSFE
jgi:pimeloyl-ACP methyl ester carboxylesterase